MAQDALRICSCSSINRSVLRGHARLPHSSISPLSSSPRSSNLTPGYGIPKSRGRIQSLRPISCRGSSSSAMSGQPLSHSFGSPSTSNSSNFSLGGCGSRNSSGRIGIPGPIWCRGFRVRSLRGQLLPQSLDSPSAAPNSPNFGLASYGISSSALRGQPLLHSSAPPPSSPNSANFSLGGYGIRKSSGRTPSPRPVSCNGSAAANPEDVVKQLGKALWGKGLPPGALVDVARQLWGTGWQVMMGQLAPSKNEGEYDRPQSQFRARPLQERIVPGNFHLYVATTCPWAHRALIVHSLKGLGDAVPVTVAIPGTSGLWEFSPATKNSGGDGSYPGTEDKANGKARLLDAYKGRKGGYEGRATVPMLWDQNQREIVNNESADIIEILNSDFNDLASNPGLDLTPTSLKADIDRWNGIIYNSVNNGVYRCGFAQGQNAYEGAVDSLFTTLDLLEEHLASSRYLCGDSLTLADVRLFTTLYRFDPVYNTLFKCTKQKLVEYPNMSGYLRDIYQIQGVSATCDLEAIMDGYYRVLFPLNPGSIRPAIPRSSQPSALMLPHNREQLSKVAAKAGVTY